MLHIPLLHAIFLGILQGATELLPISSSAHLFIVPWFFGWQYQGLAFDVALHLGTLLGLVAFLWSDWVAIFKGVAKRDYRATSLLIMIIIACIPGALFGVLFEKQAEDVFRSPIIIAITASSFGILLWLADAFGKGTKSIERITLWDSILIGLSQALAIIPGVSRSGATITAGLALGLRKEDSARFSFLLATPIIAGAALWEGRKIVSLGGFELHPLIGGFIASALTSYLAVWFLLRFLRKGNFLPFVIYRFLFAFIILMFIIFKS